ncbi:hypothetical protein P9875_15885 [Janthinobacterium rivuli]|uniref:Uncharacterized protein n=1 Tax=Janthinobacterium rivuli TaxID=2751478 RepID=A0ABY8HX78_9BURK|nr:hypothetical protein [Janthinobacterium rivuli]WFR77204.1 hypothetical protein P9875_15885 [Janthinobacterium rivuli]
MKEPRTPPEDVAKNAATAASQLDAKVASLAHWRGQTLASVRALIRAAMALNTSPTPKRTTT